MTKISNATLVAAATANMKMPTGEVGDLAVSVGQIRTFVENALDPKYWKVTGTTTITGPVSVEGTDSNSVAIKNINTGQYETAIEVSSGAAAITMATNANHLAKFRTTGSLGITAIAQMYTEDDNGDYISFVAYSNGTFTLDSSIAGFAGIRWTGWNSNDFTSDTLVPKGYVDNLVTGVLLAANNLSDILSAPSARTNLGATTVGGNLFTLTNPGAIKHLRINADNTVSVVDPNEFIGLACSDETTVLAAASTSIPVATFHVPYAMTLTRVFAGLRTAGTGASQCIVDIHVNGTTIMTTTKILFTASVKLSADGTLTTTALAAGDYVEIFLDQRDTSNVATGLKTYLVGYK